MKTSFPQEKIQRFLDHVSPALPHAMETLLHPTPSLPLIGRIQGWLDLLAPAAESPALLTIRAGLLVLADDLPAAHSLVQNIDSPHAAAWHALIHRREADFWNSNYWWRRANPVDWRHLSPALATLLTPADPTLASWLTKARASAYSPAQFTDLVEHHHHSPATLPFLQSLSRLEWQALMHDTLLNA